MNIANIITPRYPGPGAPIRHTQLIKDAKEIVERVNSGKSTVSQEAKKYDCSRSTIYKLRKDTMGKDHCRLQMPDYTQEEIDLVVMLTEEGWTAKDIAAKLDDPQRSPNSVAQIKRKHIKPINYPEELERTSIRDLAQKNKELDGSSKYIVNHLRRQPYAVIPLDEYLRLKTNTDNK